MCVSAFNSFNSFEYTITTDVHIIFQYVVNGSESCIYNFIRHHMVAKKEKK